MSHRRTPSQSRGHSRMKSDDYKLLLDSDDSPVFHLQQLGEASPLEEPLPVLIQPKLQCVSVVRIFLRSTGVRLAAILRGKSWVDLFTNPLASIIVLLFVVAITVSLGLSSFFLYKPYIDKSLQSFETPNHIASERHDALKEAIKSTVKLDLHSIIRRGKRSLSSYSSYPDAWPKSFPGMKTPTPLKKRRDPKEYQQIYSRGSLELVYLAIGDEEANIFTKERLLTIHRVEQMMMKHKGFVDFCWKPKFVRQDPFLNDRFNACTPPISLIDFFFPSNNKYFDGQGHQNLTEKTIRDTLTFLLSKGFTYWFVDDSFSETNKKSKFLRAQLKFGFPLRGFPVHGTKKQYAIQNDMRKKFIIGYIEEFQKISTEKVQVLYGGTTIFDYEVKSALNNDVTLAFFTLLAVIILLFVFTSFSLFLTFWGIIGIAISIPLALANFLYVFKIKSLGILSGVSLFIIIGIGVDDVFVFINTFRQAKYTESLHQRMRYTVLTAGKATFFTSFTTAAAFAANCLSEMPAVHDFGLFMALIVSACWVTVLFTIPPALNLWYRYIAKWEAKIPKMINILPTSTASRLSTLPESVMQFLSGNKNHGRQQGNISLSGSTNPTTSTEESTTQGVFDDEELLQIPEGMQNHNASDDEDLLQMPEERGSSSFPILQTQTMSLETVDRNSSGEGLTCGSKIQELLYHFIALPILKGRYVMLGFFLVVLGASLYLNTQIQTSQKPPQFFRKSTNLQKFLDLQYNTSGDSSDCLICQDVINTGNDILANQAVDKASKTTSTPTNNPKTSRRQVTEGNDDMVTEEPTTVSEKVTIPAKENPTSADSIASTNKLSSEKPGLSKTYASTASSPTTVSVMDSTKRIKTTNQRLKSSTTSAPSSEVTKPTTRQKTSTQLQTTEGKKLDNDVVENNNVKAAPTVGANTNAALCPTPKYCEPADKPLLATTAIVYVVFGVKGINRTGVDDTHVIKSAGKAVLDDEFSRMISNRATTGEVLGTLCEICIALANNRQLVKPGGADCFPYVEGIQRLAERSHKPHACRDLPKPKFVAGASTRSRLRVRKTKSNVSFVIVMAFESTTYKGKSSKLMYKDYKNWEKALSDLTNDKPAAFHSAFQTSEEWVYMFREIVAVNSAIYGIVLSLCLCVAAVVIFTGHFMLALIVMLTILCVLTSVVAIFYLAGWQLGAVEAISLSILVGTSVDYCVHLVEGYILAGNSLPDLSSNKERRVWRASAAVAHIGTSLLSSALTTIFAAIPLCFTTIQFFTKFGEIVAINTATSIFYTFTICVAMLGVLAPAKFRYSWKSFLAAFAGTSLFSSVAILSLYLVSVKLTPIPGPSGSPLFATKKEYDFSVA